MNWHYNTKESYAPGITIYHGWICYHLANTDADTKFKVQGVKFEDVFHYEATDVFWIPGLDITIPRLNIDY